MAGESAAGHALLLATLFSLKIGHFVAAEPGLPFKPDRRQRVPAASCFAAAAALICM